MTWPRSPLFIQQVITEHLLCATHCANKQWAGHWNPGLEWSFRVRLFDLYFPPLLSLAALLCQIYSSSCLLFPIAPVNPPTSYYMPSSFHVANPKHLKSHDSLEMGRRQSWATFEILAPDIGFVALPRPCPFPRHTVI